MYEEMYVGDVCRTCMQGRQVKKKKGGKKGKNGKERKGKNGYVYVYVGWEKGIGIGRQGRVGQGQVKSEKNKICINIYIQGGKKKYIIIKGIPRTGHTVRIFVRQ